MCRVDLAAKEAAIARFLREYPRSADAGRGHPALRGCGDVRWSEFPGCPAAVPVLLHALLDETAAVEAHRVLASTMFSIVEMNAAMTEILPFLLRLAGDPGVPERSRLLDCVVMVAQFSEPLEDGDDAMLRWFGSDSDHPERERCRAVFARHASVVATLPEGLVSAAGQAKLRQVAGLV